MVIQIHDWKFEVDMTTTMEYSAKEAADHCDCAYCRNFYAAIDGTYPQMRPFLAQFGIDMEAPEELFPIDPVVCVAYYRAYGRVLEAGTAEITVDGQEILPLQSKGRKKTYFELCVGPMELPWVLDEPMDEVVSPANRPSVLKRMWIKFLNRKKSHALPQ